MAQIPHVPYCRKFSVLKNWSPVAGLIKHNPAPLTKQVVYGNMAAIHGGFALRKPVN